MMKDNVALRGELKIYLNDALTQHVKNTVVTAGKNYIASILSTGGSFTGNYMGIGTGVTPVDVSNVDLEVPKGTRAAGTMSVAGNTLQIESVFIANNPVTAESITEAGLFTANLGGTLVARSTFAPINKATTDSLRIIWSITVG